MKTVEVITRKGCHLCDVAVGELEAVRKGHPFILQLVHLEEHPEKTGQYGNDIPVILVDNKEVCRHRLDRAALLESLAGA